MYEKSYVLGVINTADAINTEEKVFTPTTSVQTYTPTSGTYISKVTVNAISTETKTVTPTASPQSVTPTSGKYLTKVTVNPIPSNYIIPSGTKTITENGTHNVSTYANVEVNVASSGGGDIQTCDVTLIADSAILGITIYSAMTYVDGELVSVVGSGNTMRPVISGGNSVTINNVIRGSIICLNVGTGYPAVKIHDGSGFTSPDNEYGELVAYYTGTFMVKAPTGAFDCFITAYDND